MATELTPRDAALAVASLMTVLEKAGISVRESSVAFASGEGAVIASCGWGDGDPWVVMQPGQRVTPRGVED